MFYTLELAVTLILFYQEIRRVFGLSPFDFWHNLLILDISQMF